MSAKLKEISPEKMEKIALKKQKELAKWQKEKTRPQRRSYLIYMVLIICLVYVTDEIASQITVQMKTEIANDLFAKFGSSSIGKLELLAMISYPCMAMSLFYKTLSDRFGRRLFLVVNTVGMGLGMLVIFLSNSIPLYIAGYCIISFFVPHDMQVVYIMETAPAKHRAKTYSLIKFVATLGVMLVPLMRRTLMTEPGKWRMVFLVPAIIGLVASFLALLFSRETGAFIDSRIRYLQMDEEALRLEKERKDRQNAQGGFFASLAFAMKHKQLRWLFILMSFNNLGFIITMYYQVMLSYGYAGNLASSGAQSLEAALETVSAGAVTNALFLFPVGSAVFQLFVGFISDKLGRKTAAAIMNAVTIVTFVTFALGAKLAWNPYLVGFLTGACIGSFWAIGDINIMMMSESAPTNLRSSVTSSSYVIEAIGTATGMFIILPLINIFGNTVTTLATLCISLPGLVVGFALVLFKTHETKGVDIDKVTGCEWD